MNKTLGLCLLSIGACAAIVGAASLREKMAAPDLQPLDKAMHDRFEVPENFGMGRLMRVPNQASSRIQHINAPVLASAEARKAAEELKAQGWDVNFYLGGRELFDPNVDVLAPPRIVPLQMQQQQSRSDKPRVIKRPQRALRGPVAVGTADKTAESLDQLKVADVSRRALRRFVDDKTQTEFHDNLGEWHLVAYPVNATKKSCARCHSDSKPTPQVGDTLGVTVYAYRRAL